MITQEQATAEPHVARARWLQMFGFILPRNCLQVCVSKGLLHDPTDVCRLSGMINSPVLKPICKSNICPSCAATLCALFLLDIAVANLGKSHFWVKHFYYL